MDARSGVKAPMPAPAETQSLLRGATHSMMRGGPMKDRQTVVRLLLAAIIALSAVGSAIPSPAAAAPAVPPVNWSPCYRETGFPFECAVVPVPLDYGKPGAASIQLSLVRLPATNRAERIGSLFLNPGGPRGLGRRLRAPGRAVLRLPLLAPDVAARFDLIGFDPRGMARSAALKCSATTSRRCRRCCHRHVPSDHSGGGLWESMRRKEVAACEQRAGPGRRPA